MHLGPLHSYFQLSSAQCENLPLLPSLLVGETPLTLLQFEAAQLPCPWGLQLLQLLNHLWAKALLQLGPITAPTGGGGAPPLEVSTSVPATSGLVLDQLSL